MDATCLFKKKKKKKKDWTVYVLSCFIHTAVEFCEWFCWVGDFVDNEATS